MKDKIAELAALMRDSRSTCFFGGAGVSTESGIPDFRSADGLYSEKWGELSPEEIISHDFFFSSPEEFYSFYRERMIYENAAPGVAHRALARLEDAGLITAVITQNIDGLHTAAGSSRVFELHGSVLNNTCTECGRHFPRSYVTECAPALPKCDLCGGLVKPDVTLYGEQLPTGVFEEAAHLVLCSDLLIVAGTSLGVYPAANLVKYFEGDLVIINRDPTPYDRRADIVIHAGVGEVFSALLLELGLDL